MHKPIDLKALYFGTPIVLISTTNEDGSHNLAPMSSAWWLGKYCMLGLSTRSKTFENLEREGECVLNLPTPDLVGNVNRLAMLTGKDPVPQYKMEMGYRHEPSKFEIAGLTKVQSMLVTPPRVKECAVQLEAKVRTIRPVGSKYLAGIEVEIVQEYIDEKYIIPGTNYVDTDRWSPLIMNFCEFFGLGTKLHPSALADAWFPKIFSQ